MPDTLAYVLGAVNWALAAIALLKGRGWIALVAAVASAVPLVGPSIAVVINGVAATRLGLPDSHWARRRYSPVTVSKARARHPDAPTEPKDRYPALVLAIALIYGLSVAVAAS